MASANSNIQIADLDFVNIKQNFITFLKSQDTFKDYNFKGSAISTLLDILTYNTQYNAYYLNMVANEMFLDTALQRGSVISHAKLLNYTPRSVLSPHAIINLTVSNITNSSSVSLPRYTKFLSEAVNGTSYTFVTTDSTTASVSNGIANFNNIQIKQGNPVTLTFNYSSSSNPKSVFELPDSNIDTTTLLVEVFDNNQSTSFDTYTLSTNSLGLDGTSRVYFLQEEVSGYYQITFGDGIIGKQLTDGNIILISYIVSSGTSSQGANNFALISSIGNYNTQITPVVSASGGQAQESIDSIKFQAPKVYSAQGRAVTKEDYITTIQQNNLGYAFDAVSVWGGEENNPPIYGQVFISLKPSGGYSLTSYQKQDIIQKIIKPISVLTVEPTLVDPDYTYINVSANVLYDPKKTNYSANQIQSLVTTAINNFATSTLNTFNSTFSAPTLISSIQNSDPSIISNEISIKLQKKFYPNLVSGQTYKLYYGSPLTKGSFLSGVSSSPALKFLDATNKSTTIGGVYIEEVPTTTLGVDTISVINPGFGYQSAPKITILGDGQGANAVVEITSGGIIKSISVTSSGNNYTSAIAVITPASGDTTGQSGSAIVNLQGKYGTLRTYYFNSSHAKTILNSFAGTIDYSSGIVTLNSFSPSDVDNDLGQFTVSATPVSTIISSAYNRIITIDQYDPTAITVNVTAKSS